MRLTYAQIHAVRRLPESLIRLELLKLHTKKLPNLSDLVNLRELSLGFCEGGRTPKLVEDPMPWWIGRLRKLESLTLISKVVVTLSADIGLLSHLKTLELRCPNLRYLPRPPASLSSLSLQNYMSVHAIDLSNLKKLSKLTMTLAAITEIQGLDCLEYLQTLSLVFLGCLEVLPDLSNSKKLRKLHIEKCECLVEIQGKMPASLELLMMEKCESLEKLPDLSSLEGPEEIKIYACVKLNVEVIPGYAEKREETYQ
ncbi:disease resistance protein RML1A-like isoform X1 [Rhodamnia argentea]|uniref:Disease resistance protein RML1A-like isoform X1 n=1 Tax=Rhodamnia argentea TaxID=178133 RepID=A0ABM3HNQ1_9MYRT|nr:disease resistance protein RML1A-like isoform X1 [Rhodamnia argentea]